MVEPSSALRSCASEYRIPFLPHLGHSIFESTRSVCTLCFSTTCTVESSCRSGEGKSVGFVLVTIVLEEVSGLCSVCRPAQLSAVSCFPLTLIVCAAAIASQGMPLVPRRFCQQIAAVRTEDQRSNGGHDVDFPVVFNEWLGTRGTTNFSYRKLSCTLREGQIDKSADPLWGGRSRDP
jgi:hypothetical protein